jgi:hypothetical protein
MSSLWLYPALCAAIIVLLVLCVYWARRDDN